MQRALRTFIVLVLGNLTALNLFGSTPPYAQPSIASSAITNNTIGDRFTLETQSNQVATVYYVVSTTNTNPSAADIRAGKLGDGSTAPIQGTFAAAATTTTQVITGLTVGTLYYVNFIIENGGGEQSGVGTESATATDTTPPTYTSSTITNIAATKFDYNVNISEDADVHYVVTTSNTAPTVAQVLAGKDNTGATAFKSGTFPVTAATTTPETITGLAQNTTYYVYSVAQDPSTNNSTVRSNNATTLTDVTAPTYSSSTIANIAATQFDYRVNVSEDATIHYVVTTSNTAPTVAQVLAGKDNTGATAFKSGTFAAAAATVTPQTITGLAQTTTYYVYSVAQDPSTNNSTVRSNNATTLADTTAPTYNSSSTFNPTESTFDYKVNLNEAATVYYVVTTSATTPTAAQIQAGKDNTGATALKFGNFAAATAGTDAPTTISGLNASTTYHIYSVAKDAAGNVSTVDSKTATTTADTTAPTYTASTQNPANTQFEYKVNASEDATIYYVVTTSATAPTAAQIKTGKDNTGATALKSGNYTVTGGLDDITAITGLSPNTTYHIYSVAVDGATNTSTVDHKTATTTTDTTAPTYTSSGITNVGSTTFDYTVKVSEDATIYYVVTTSATAPTATQIKAGNNNTGSPALVSGTFSATANTDTQVPGGITGLTTGTTYYVYSVAVDPSTNTSTVRSNNATTSCAAVNVTAAAIDDNTTSADLTWTNSGCFDEVLIVVRAGSAVTATPTGNGSGYTANAAFGSGTQIVTNEYVVYKGNGSSTTVNNLVSGTVYYYKIFTRKGTSWSSGVELMEGAGSPRVVSFDPADGASNVNTDQVFTITFNENVVISSAATTPNNERIVFDKSGSGDLNVIRDNSGDGTITISGNVATITLNSDLDINTAYDILIGNRVFRDASINYYGGTVAGNWNFTTTSVGVSITAPTNGICSGQYANIGNIVINEGNDNNFQGTDDGTFTFILSLDKSGFAFKSGTAGVTAIASPGGDIQTISVTSVSFTQAVFSIKFKDVANNNAARDDHDQITISGLKVSTDDSNTPPVHVVVDNATTIGIQGISKGTTPLATITSGSTAPMPTVSWASGNGTYCAGTQNLTTLAVTAAGGTSYKWYSDAALTTVVATGASQMADPLFGTAPGTGTHTRYVTNVNGCESPAVTVTLVITANPTAEAGTAISVCSNELVALGGNPTATGGGGSYTYAWSDGGTYSATASNPSFTAGPNNGTTDINTVYTVLVTDVNGCSATDNVTVSIKGSPDAVLITEPNTFFYTSANSPVNLKGSPAGGIFSGVGVVQYNGSYTFDPEVAGIGSWPVKYTATLPNGCTKSITKNFDVSAPFEVFAGLEDQYCNNEGQVNLTLAPAMVTQIMNYISTWNSQYVLLYGYAPLKPTFTGIVRNQYAAASPYGYGNNGGVVKSPTNAQYVSGGQTLDRYIFKPQAFATDAAYPGCTTCGYAYVTVYLEFLDPLFTYPYNIPANSDQGYTFNNGTTAAFSYTNQYVAVNPVPLVFFSGLKSGLVGGDTNFCNADVNYNITGNKVGGQFEISSNNVTFNDALNDGILNTTAGNAQFNPQDAYGGATNMVTRYVRYSVDPGTTGSTTQGCIGRSTQTVQVHPSTPISFGGSVDPNNKEYCYEAPGKTVVTDQTSNVIFSGYGIADNGNSGAVFTPQVAFDQKDPAATTAQTITISAVYTNNIGCQTTITRDYKVFPKPQSTFTLTQDGSPTTSVNFCYGTPTVVLNGNQPTGSTQQYSMDYISSLGFVEPVPGNVLNFNPAAYYDKAVTKGNSNVGDAQFNISYIITDQIGCTASTSKILTVSPLAEIVISGIHSGDNFCSNSVPFGVTFAPVGGSLEINDVTATPKLDANNTLSSINIPIGNVKIKYIYRSGLSQCYNEKVYTVGNIAAPDAKFATVPTCDRDEVTFSALNDPNSFKWTWVLGDSVRSGTNTQTIKHVFPGLSGATQTSYTIKLVSENDPAAPLVCRDSAEAVQVIGAYPKTDFNYANLCHDDFTRFSITSDIPIATAEWDFGDSFALGNNPLNTAVPAGTHSNRTKGKFGQPEHQFSFTTGVANRYMTRLIARTATALGACRDTVVRQVAILEKLAPTPANPYMMSEYAAIEGLWLEEDRGDSSTWIFDLPTGKVNIKNTVGDVWVTNATGTYKAKDNSYVNSPCFDLSAFTKPVFSLQYWDNTDPNKDGAVLQYSVDGGATWSVLGNTSSGLEWFNEQAISAAPGGQNQLGWSGRAQTAWKTGKNSLDGLNVSNVRFRVAFASDERDQFDGFAFNNVRIDERNRIMLIEHFTNVVAEASNNNVQSKTNFNTAPELSNETVRLQYHTSFPGPDPINSTAPADHNARTAYYGLASENIPAGFIDGSRNPVISELSFKTNWYRDVTNKRSLNASPFKLFVETLPASDDGITIHVVVNRIDDVTSSKPVLHIALVEKAVAGNNQFVLRKMLPTAAGTPMKAKASDAIPSTFEATYSWPVNYFDDLAQLAVIAFVQDETTREVFQAYILATPDPSTVPSVITGVEPSFGSQVSFYPNPADHTVNVVLPEGSQGDIAVTVIDAFGREVVVTEFAKGDKGGAINTSTLAAGVYVVQLQTPKGTLRRKIIVAHD